MTDRDIKQQLKSAYSVSGSVSGRMFIKEHEKRSRQLFDVAANELRNMGLKSVFAGMLLCFPFIAAAAKGDENMMWVVSSMIPACSVLPMTLMLRSERYGMNELEAASRFSLKFIRLVRMLVSGMFSSLIILGGSIFSRKLLLYETADIVLYMLFPYFASIRGCLFIARKWHGKESSIGVPLICMFTGFLPTAIRELRKLNFAPDHIYVLFTALIMAAAVRECAEYINERSDLLWN